MKPLPNALINMNNCTTSALTSFLLIIVMGCSDASREVEERVISGSQPPTGLALTAPAGADYEGANASISIAVVANDELTGNPSFGNRAHSINRHVAGPQIRGNWAQLPDNITQAQKRPSPAGKAALPAVSGETANELACTDCLFWDIDHDGITGPLSDGLLVMRYLFGFSGDALVQDAVTQDAQRTSATDISIFLTNSELKLDIDGDGELTALGDGLLFIRYQFGFSGSALTDNAISATATRRSSTSVEAYIQARSEQASSPPGGTSTNLAPQTTADTAVTDEDNTVSIDVLENDTDSDSLIDVRTLTIQGRPEHGMIEINAGAGTLTYSPTDNFYGADSFSYTVEDTEGAESNATQVTITVNSVNDAPQASADTAGTDEGVAVLIAVLDNDSDVDGSLDPASVQVVNQPSGGSLSLNSSTGSLTYSPAAGTTGTDTFTYTVNDNDGAQSSPVQVTVTVNAAVSNQVSVSGIITFDLIPESPPNKGWGLDYDEITETPVRAATIQIIDVGNPEQPIVSEGITDEAGSYSLLAPMESAIRVRVLAESKNSDGAGAWNVTVVDNSVEGKPTFALDSDDVNTQSSDIVVDLYAVTPWNGTTYDGPRSAAPFAILDTVTTARQYVMSGKPDLVLPPLRMNWSVGSTDGTYFSGGVSGGDIYLTGDADNDTDEYDRHVIAHEWAHYFSSALSMDDSMGGSHGAGDLLDMRIAFSEGWANAFSALALNDQIYQDTSGELQAGGFGFDIEYGTRFGYEEGKGWYSESAVYLLTNDLSDSNNDSGDADGNTISVSDLMQVVTEHMASDSAPGTIFSYVNAMIKQVPDQTETIRSLTDHFQIGVDTTTFSSFGEGELSDASEFRDAANVLPVFYNIVVDDTPQLMCQDAISGTYNKLANRRYFSFEITDPGSYRFLATPDLDRSANSEPDPDFCFQDRLASWNPRGSYCAAQYVSEDPPNSGNGFIETTTVTLEAGSYWGELYDWNNIAVDDDAENVITGEFCQTFGIESQ